MTLQQSQRKDALALAFLRQTHAQLPKDVEEVAEIAIGVDPGFF